MRKDEEEEKMRMLSLPKTSPSELRGRQSVRATFKLSERAISAISVASVHLGIKKKSLIDHLLEDRKSLTLIAREIQAAKFKLSNRIQKTFVMSRKTLSCLDQTSKAFDTPRDALVEYSIQRLLPLIERERGRHRKRKEVLKALNDYLSAGKRLLKKSERLLGADDPVNGLLDSALEGLDNAQETIRSFVEKGEGIETF